MGYKVAQAGKVFLFLFPIVKNALEYYINQHHQDNTTAVTSSYTTTFPPATKMSILPIFPELDQRMSLQAGFKEILDNALEALKTPELHRDTVLTEQTVLLVSGSIRWSIRLEMASVSSRMLDLASQALYGQQIVANVIKNRLASNNRAGNDGAARNGPAHNGPANNGRANNGEGSNSAGNGTAGSSAES
jgi:hypothetical protein